MYWRQDTRKQKSATCLKEFKEFNDPKNKKVSTTTPVYIEKQPTITAAWNIEYQITFRLCFTTYGYDAHLFIKELGSRLNKNDIGLIAENKEK